MSSENKRQKLSSSSSQGFQSWWTEDCGMISSNNKAVCVLCSNTVVCRSLSIKHHFEMNHRDLNLKTKEEQKEVISKALKERKIQSSSLMKFIGGSSNATAAASYIVSNKIAKHGNQFSDEQFIKQAWLECASVLFEIFKEKEKIIQRIKEIPLSRNTIKVGILDIADNVSHQQSTDITSCDLMSICLDGSTDVTEQVLCATTASKSLQEIMNVVTKLINLISARALNKQKFQQLLSDMDSMHGGLLMYYNVQWLSRGKVLQRFVECLDEIILFLTTKKILEKYKELSDGQWILKLMFFTDLCLHVNELNSGLQVRNKAIITMCDLVKAFAAKLQVFYRDVASKTFKYFENTKKYFFTT